MNKITIFWHRRDIRLADNAGLYHALRGQQPVLPIFIFDRHILDELEDRKDRRVSFIHFYINKLSEKLQEQGSALRVEYGYPLEVFKKLCTEYEIAEVYTNHDYEPYAIKRDAEIEKFLSSQQIPFMSYKDQCIFEKSEVVKDDGGAYTVYTPYSRKWMATLDPDNTDEHYRSYPTEKYFDNFYRTPPFPVPSIEEMGFEPTHDNFPERKLDKAVLRNYADSRNFPAEHGTTRLSAHLRFGTVSIRHLVQVGLSYPKWLNELVWRDFYMMILANFPQVVDQNFHQKYDGIKWRNDEEEFRAWCEGRTGYPIVDAGMRELNETGYMHNRVRMITASFLTKHLLIDWRWGERYFAQKLLDYELSSNNGGWQWAAGTGTDAQPYFRIFNPYSQTDKFDKDRAYIRKWVPEIDTPDYPKPIVEHKQARERALRTYKQALGKE